MLLQTFAKLANNSLTDWSACLSALGTNRTTMKALLMGLRCVHYQILSVLNEWVATINIYAINYNLIL